MTFDNPLWRYVGLRLHHAIVKMDIPIEDLPWIDGRLNVFEFLKTWEIGHKVENPY